MVLISIIGVENNDALRAAHQEAARENDKLEAELDALPLRCMPKTRMARFCRGEDIDSSQRSMVQGIATSQVR